MINVGEYFLIVFLLTVLDLFEDFPENCTIPNFSSMEHRQLYMCLTQTLLALLAKYPESFKTLIHKIPPVVKTKLENIIKSVSSTQEPNRGSSVNGNSQASSRTAQPKIQLKNFSIG